MAASKLALLAAAFLTMAAAPDSELDRRLASFKAGGWDALTVPPGWYEPRIAAIVGSPRARPAGPSRRIGKAVLAKAAQAAEADGASALIVAEDGRIVAEHYWHGASAETRFNPQSMAKTLVSLLIGIAIDRREIASASDPLGKYMPEWKRDPRGSITLAQLLQMASGLAQVDAGHGFSLTPDNPAAQQYFGSDFDRHMLALPLKGEPGKTFDYNNNATKLLARVLENASNKPYAALLSERLWKPLGLHDAGIYSDLKGRAMVSCCVFSQARDWVQVGRLIAGRGEIDGRRIVSAAWVGAMTKPSPAYRGYGYQIWLGDQQVGGPPQPPIVMPWQSEAFAARDLIFLNGFGGQRVWIMPKAGLIVVRFGQSWPKAWDDAALPNLLYRGIKA